LQEKNEKKSIKRLIIFSRQPDLHGSILNKWTLLSSKPSLDLWRWQLRHIY